APRDVLAGGDGIQDDQREPLPDGSGDRRTRPSAPALVGARPARHPPWGDGLLPLGVRRPPARRDLRPRGDRPRPRVGAAPGPSTRPARGLSSGPSRPPFRDTLWPGRIRVGEGGKPGPARAPHL